MEKLTKITKVASQFRREAVLQFAKEREKQSGSKDLEPRSCRLWELIDLHEMKCFHRLDTLAEYEQLKVTALNLFHPTASPSLKSRSSHV